MKVTSTIEVLETGFKDIAEYQFASFSPALAFINGQRRNLERAGMKTISSGVFTVLVDDCVRLTYQISNS